MSEILKSLKQRSVWLLILPALLVLSLADFALVKTLVEWSLFALVLAGLAIIVSMVIFPQINLTDLVNRARAGEQPAATVAAALLVFFGLLFYSMVFWAKA